MEIKWIVNNIKPRMEEWNLSIPVLLWQDNDIVPRAFFYWDPEVSYDFEHEKWCGEWIAEGFDHQWRLKDSEVKCWAYVPCRP